MICIYDIALFNSKIILKYHPGEERNARNYSPDNVTTMYKN